MPSATAYLESLNPEQRRAVEHGAGLGPCAPLLVIAGAGSGKTNTLAHRVAHLIVNGADPRADRLLGLFEKTSWPFAAANAALRSASQGPRVDVGARMRGMWR